MDGKIVQTTFPVGRVVYYCWRSQNTLKARTNIGAVQGYVEILVLMRLILCGFASIGQFF